LLKKVHLGGIVAEAVVDFGTNSIQAVDPTNSLFIKATEASPKDKTIGRVGVGDLSVVIKHLEAIKGEVAISKQGNRLVISAKDRGEIKYLTVAEEFVASVVAEDNISALLEPCLVTCNLSQQACLDYSAYRALIKTKAATFTFDAASQMIRVDSGLESENQFTVPFGQATGLADTLPETFSVTVYGHHADQIFGILDWSKPKEPPLIMMAPGHPLIVAQDDDNIWACLPLGEAEAGEKAAE
jgi:hypothetical protein